MKKGLNVYIIRVRQIDALFFVFYACNEIQFLKWVPQEFDAGVNLKINMWVAKRQ